MKKNTRFIGLALAGLVALLLPLKADATCGSSISFQGYPISVVTGTLNGPALRANFWVLNSGNPAQGPGNDNGLLTAQLDWLIPSPAGLAINGDWAGQNYDGCPDAAGAPDIQRMVVSFSDVNAAGDMTYAVACVHRDTTAAVQFGFNGVGHAIALVPAARAAIANTVRQGNEAVITVGTPNFADGFSTDGSSGCDVATVIPQFDVYKQTTARGVPPTASNDAGGQWALVGTCNTSGSPACTVTTTCGATNCDNYLAVVPHYNSNFTTADAASGAAARVSARSANVQAGPTLAETPKPKKIKNEQVGPKKLQN